MPRRPEAVSLKTIGIQLRRPCPGLKDEGLRHSTRGRVVGVDQQKVRATSADAGEQRPRSGPSRHSEEGALGPLHIMRTKVGGWSRTGL